MKVAKQGGLTLIEMVLTILILSIALVMISSMLAGGLGRTSDTTQELRSVALAQSYLDEILGKRFDENSAPRGIPPCSTGVTVACDGSLGPEPGELREDYDDVDDYHGLDEGDGQVNPLRDAAGATRTGYDNFRVQVSVRYIDIGVEEVSLGVAANDLDDNEDAKLITVTVSYTAAADGVSYSAYKANF